MKSEKNKTNFLEKFSINLNQSAREGKLDPVIGREDEIRRCAQVLSRRTKNNPILIGEPGVGKTAVAEGLALRIINNDVPESLINKDIISLDLGALIAGAKFRGEFEERLKIILNEITNNIDGIILFIDEIHTLVGAGKSEGSMDASNLLKPALARGELRCIGATTLNEYRENIEKDAALARRFQQVLINEPSINDSISILRGLKEKYEIHHGIKILDSALISAVKLSKRYINDRFLPDKAIDLVDEAASSLRIEVDSKPEELDVIERKILQNKIESESIKKENDDLSNERFLVLKNETKKLENQYQELDKQWKEEKNKINQIQKLKSNIEQEKNKLSILQRDGKLTEAGEIIYSIIPSLESQLKNFEKKNENQMLFLKESVSEKEITEVVAKWTGIPINKMLESKNEKILNIHSELKKKIIGQDDAIKFISSAVQRSSAGIQDPDKPIGVFMFLGPTGVGKTELSKALSRFLFNEENAFLRIDMSEYIEKHSISKLIGSPPGYIGYEDAGILTEPIRRRPYQVILLDEIEKAHLDVFNLLLQVFDDGRLTDNKGKTVNFKNTIIIMTSNIGAEHFEFEDSEKNKLLTRNKILTEINKSFKPEFINRIDEIVIFDNLSENDLIKIVDIQISKLKNQLLEKNIKIKIKDNVKNWLADKGFNPAFGARPLKRVIQKYLIDELAKKILSLNTTKSLVFEIFLKNDKLIIEKL
tara:strand:- start:69646 stop:71772 length:2127 start_codon:yes stop_codon:yes gene_type:complete